MIHKKKCYYAVEVCVWDVWDVWDVWVAYASTSTTLRVCSFQTPTKSPVSAQYA